ncbi:hypothetical protein P152DRAFT_292932 [Eremomyces bilateralis CBS 781.70]|uniref:Uncharacterized protein n=1 Tax=Eremomyces bilateralis CBS 781.70 TaxID=1392243 RepID=A0A6G1G6Z4_9PEZI|nr:uncharacterized protein P152DRAFT_292932 [Eremomyces bilateralis CBS 781.70]KAF1813818.1 hypothetical protein P152DRAFT_292932 [Eremomyces bilateralis CBS 781.70]
MYSPTLRSLYRRFLRELPARSPTTTILSDPSPLQYRIRASFSSPSIAAEPNNEVPSGAAEADQFVQYLTAQRQYTTLVERYNPGASMSEEEKVRLTARRVGMELPKDVMGDKL